MEKWILTISENKYDSVMTYVIDEQSIPLGLTVEDIVLKIISKIVVDAPGKDAFDYAERENDCSWVIQYFGYHYDVVLQKMGDFIVNVSDGLDEPIKNKEKLIELLKYSDSTVSYEKLKKDIKREAGIKNMKQSFSFN